jgi:hypothetical protein
MTLEVFQQTTDTVAIVASAGSTRVALADPKDGKTERFYMLFNSGLVDAFVAFGSSTIEAGIPTAGVPANGMPLPAGCMMPVRRSSSDTHMAAITGSSTTPIYVTTGQGF